MQHITDLTEGVMSMFITNGVSTKKEALDFLKTIKEVAHFVSSRDWELFKITTTNDASKLIVKLTQEDSRRSNSNSFSHEHERETGFRHRTSHGAGSSHGSSRGSSHGSSHGHEHRHGHRNSSNSPQVPKLKVNLPTSLQMRAVVSSVPGFPGVPGVALVGNPFLQHW